MGKRFFALKANAQASRDACAPVIKLFQKDNMSNPDWLKIKEVFYQTLDLPEAEREDFLAQQNNSVRTEIRELIKANEQAEKFIAEPAVVEFGLNGKSLIGRKIANYTLLEIIGTGGMGTVFLAEKEGLEKKFAVKLIKRGMDTDEVLRRFKLEKQILARLEHPNIAPLLDGGMTDDGLPFLVMEYVEGVSIARFCDERELEIKERLKLFREVCSAVSYAHQNLIIHRDLKPSNILVTKDGTPKLLDFGIAKLLNPDGFEDTATTMQARMFTPEYASPEQLNGEPITTASDVYSLGVVLYELLSGQRPFQSNSRNYQEIVRQILTNEPVRPSVISNSRFQIPDSRADGETSPNKGQKTNDEKQNSKFKIQNSKFLKGDLDNIILKALRKEPARRYNSVPEFSEDIRRHLAGLPVTATADTRVYRFSKFVQRHKSGVLVGALVSVLILSISAIAVRQSIVATRANRKSEERLKDIREVAKSLMTETNDSLQKIPGNVNVQKALTEKSVALLDKLAADETNDATLLVELADAYTKLAEIQNWSFREFDKALENLNKAEAIYQKLLQIEPANVKIRRKLHSSKMRRIEAVIESKNREQTFQIGFEAIENLQEIVRLEPEFTTNIADLAAMFGWFGDKKTLFGKKDEATENYRRGVATIEQAIELQKSQGDSLKSKAEVSRFYLIKGWLLKGVGDNRNAVENYRMSAEIADRIYLEEAGFTDNFLRAVGSYQKIGEIYESENNFKAALESYLKGKDQAKIGLKNKNLPNPAEIQIYECFFTVEAARMFDKSGDQNEARKYFTEGETLCRQTLAQNPDRIETIHEELERFYAISNFYFAAGERERSVLLLKEIAEKLETVVDKNEWDLETAFVLADTYEKIGDFQTDKQAREFYEKSGKIWTKYQQNYQLLPDEISKMEAVRKKLQSSQTSKIH
jgi:eukaryotic-like serine/threonine-protein kinase